MMASPRHTDPLMEEICQSLNVFGHNFSDFRGLEDEDKRFITRHPDGSVTETDFDDVIYPLMKIRTKKKELLETIELELSDPDLPKHERGCLLHWRNEAQEIIRKLDRVDDLLGRWFERYGYVGTDGRISSLGTREVTEAEADLDMDVSGSVEEWTEAQHERILKRFFTPVEPEEIPEPIVHAVKAASDGKTGHPKKKFKQEIIFERVEEMLKAGNLSKNEIFHLLADEPGKKYEAVKKNYYDECHKRRRKK